MNPRETIIAFVCCFELAACAAQVERPAGHAPPAERERRIAAAEADLRRSESALAALSAEKQPDCGRVCNLVTNICDLAERICALAAEESTLHVRCTDATGRCQSARVSTARCRCP